MSDASFQPDWFSKPGDTLLTLMEQRELSAESLAQKLGCSNSVVRGLIAGTVAIDSALAQALSKHVGGTTNFWEVRQQKYQGALSRAAAAVTSDTADEWIKRFPHADIAKNGWIKHSRNRSELVKSYLAYFGVNNPAEWEERYADFLKLTAFRTSPKFQSKWSAFGVVEAGGDRGGTNSMQALGFQSSQEPAIGNPRPVQSKEPCLLFTSNPKALFGRRCGGCFRACAVGLRGQRSNAFCFAAKSNADTKFSISFG